MALSSTFSDNLTTEFLDLFAPGLGCFKDRTFSLCVDQSVNPKFCKARSVPYAMKWKLDQAYDSLLADGIMSPVSYTTWAAPIVPVLKSDGSTRVYGHYKLTVNRATKLDAYPIPRVEDLFASLAGGRIFFQAGYVPCLLSACSG